MSEKHSSNGGPGDVSKDDWETVRNLERKIIVQREIERETSG